MFEVSSDIYFVVYNLYYVDQNGDLGIRARPINRDGGSNFFRHANKLDQNNREAIVLFPKANIKLRREKSTSTNRNFSYGSKQCMA
jgi:hypothetical protein